MKIDYTLIGIRIRQERMQQNLSQEDLAYMADLSNQFISNIERGRKTPSLPSLIQIAKALGVPLSTLLNEDDVPSEPLSEMDLLLETCTPIEREFIYKLIIEALKALRSTSK